MPRFDAGVRDFMLQIGTRPATGRLSQHELFAWTFASLEIGRSVVDLRTASAAGSPSGEWRARERALCTSIAQLFEQPSSETLLAAERAATDALATLDRGSTDASHAVPHLADCVAFMLLSLQYNLVPLQRPLGSPHETPQ